jgi:hypothetical protein
MSTKQRSLLVIGLIFVVLAVACVRAAPTQDLAAVDHAIETEDASIQLTLQALLGSATAENLLPTSTPEPSEPSATPTLPSVQLTSLAETLTAVAVTPTETEELESVDVEGTPTETRTPEPTGTPCYAARYAYDENYPDGTRVDPGQLMTKTWRLQNIGNCDWVAGQYELVFVGGDRMAGTSPLTINITVLAGNYANFSMNMKAPPDPGTYHGDWILRTKGGDIIGLGPNADLPFWIEIVVRGN